MDEECLQILGDCLGQLSIPPSSIRQQACLQQLRQGDSSDSPVKPVDLLALDSMGLIELCIFLELDHRIVISPIDLGSMSSLKELEQRMGARCTNERAVQKP